MIKLLDSIKRWFKSYSSPDLDAVIVNDVLSHDVLVTDTDLIAKVSTYQNFPKDRGFLIYGDSTKILLATDGESSYWLNKTSKRWMCVDGQDQNLPRNEDGDVNFSDTEEEWLVNKRLHKLYEQPTVDDIRIVIDSVPECLSLMPELERLYAGQVSLKYVDDVVQHYYPERYDSTKDTK